MLRTMVLALSAAISIAAPAATQPYTPAFDPAQFKGPHAGTPNSVMVLGSPHLSGLPEGFNPATLELLLDRLANWQPKAIAIEALSGLQCDFMRRHPARYNETVEDYCWDTTPAQAATGLDVPAATVEADRLLAAWPNEPTPGQRRRLAAVFLAAGEQTSALVQWLRLPAPERRTGNGLDAALVARLEHLTTRRNENYLLAAPLAARLGLERVYPMDDHTPYVPINDEKAYGEAIQRAWDNPASARQKAISTRLYQQIGTGEDILAMYRAHNAPDMAKLVFEADFGAALEEPSPQGFGRGYVGYWETRNLRMTANIRNMLAVQPGTRALVIVGASHKAYLEAYLNMMHDVRLADANEALR